MTHHHAILLRVADPDRFEIANYFTVPQLISLQYPSIGIAEVRGVITEAHRRPVDDSDFKTIVIHTNLITQEAQHALLKILEEPPESTRFAIVIPHDLPLLATLLSRLHQEIVHEEVSSNINQTFTNFLETRFSNRIKQIEKHSRDVEWIQSFKSGLIQYLTNERRSLTAEQLVSLEYVASHLLTRGASNKFLLDHAALVLPA